MIFENNKDASISPIKIKPEMRIKVLDDQDLERIHEATLTVLKETGVRFPCERALNIFAGAGAHVDFKNQNVKIQPDFLMEALSKAPREFTMGSRGNQDLDIFLDGTKTYCGTAGTGTTTVGLESRKQRASVKNDIAMMALVADYLPSISFFWPMVTAQDSPPEVLPLHELEASFTNTEKHVHIVSCVEEKAAKYAVEMADIVAGGKERMKTRPPLSLIASPVSPLGHDKGAVEAALVFAEAGLPVGFAAMPVLGSTAPASIAGSMVMGNAEILSAACLIQLASPGAPVMYPLFLGMLNPFTGGCLVSTEIQHLFYAGTVQLGHYYNLPVMSGFGGSDLHEPTSWKVGKDDSINAFFTCAAGPDMLPCLGMLGAYTLLYPEKILFDDEIFQSIKHMTNGMRVDFETLALDEILAVGPGGHFFDRDYTIKNIRKLWRPGVSRQWSHREEAFRDPQQAAVEQVQWILKNHKPKPLEKKAEQELGKIIKAAEKEIID